MFKPILHSHTHCQAAQANAETQAWQRVCLSNRTPKTTDKPTDEKEHRSDNITYTQAGVSCFVGQESGKIKVQFFVGSSVDKNPCLRIAENRYVRRCKYCSLSPALVR
jgi:hypothetical protein